MLTLSPKLAERARQLKIKNGVEMDAEMGPIVTAAAKQRITGYIDVGDKRTLSHFWWKYVICS